MHKAHQVRLLDESDYAEIGSWFSRRGWPSPPRWEHLPRGDRAVGVVDDSGRLCACGFIYYTETPLTILEWVATNPDISSLKSRYKAITLLLDAVKILVQHHRTDAVLIQFMVSSGLKKLYERQGFKVGDQGLTSMIWRE
jgi:hypothetical protein